MLKAPIITLVEIAKIIFPIALFFAFLEISIARGIFSRSSSIITRSLLSTAASVLTVPIAMPTSALEMHGRSLIPSPQ